MPRRDVTVQYAPHVDDLDALEELVTRYEGGAVHDILADARQARENGGPDRGDGLVWLSTVEPETVRWLWESRVPLGKLTMLDGDPGLGKSTVALDLAARLSTGRPMPDGTHPDLDGPAATVLLTAEDGIADTVRPRFDAAGGDPDGLAVLKHTPDDRLPTVEDAGSLARAVVMADAKLVVVDPLMAYLPEGVNSHRDQDVRRALAPLAELADDLGAAVVCIRHLNKSGGGNPKYRGGGSIGLIGAARSGLVVGEDPDAPDTRRILAPTKANLSEPAPSLSYRLQAADGAVCVVWEGESDHNAHDLLDRPSGDERSAREEAEHILREELREGRRPVEELEHVADDLRVSWSTVERAKRALGVKSEREGFGKGATWYWRLPEEDDGQEGKDGDAYGGDGPSEPASGRDESIDVTGGDAYAGGPEPQGGSGDSDPIDVTETDPPGDAAPGDGEVLL